MPKVVALHCPHCRAPLPAVQPGQTVVHCAYCNNDTNIAHTQHMPAATDPRMAADDPRRARAVASAGKGKGAGIVFAVMMGLVTVGIVMAFTQMKSRQAQRAGQAATIDARKPREYFTDRHVPMLADIDGDKVDDIVTLFRTVVSVDSKTVTTVFATAHSGTTFKRLWVTTLGGENGYYFRIGIAGGKVVVADDKNVVHVLDLATGAERSQVTVSDRAAEVCAADATHAWVGVTDDANVLIDLASGTAVPAPRPEGCVKREQGNCHSWDAFRDDRPVTAHCVDYSEVGQVDDMNISFMIGEGAHVVAVGTRKKGTGFPMLAGFDATASANTKSKPLWTRRVNEDPKTAMDTTSSPRGIDMAFDQIGLIYDAGKENRLQLSDAATGAVVWDVTLDDDGITPENIAIRADRVYVPHEDMLSVFERKTGKLLGQLGTK